jgi:hypothetical protein
LCNLAGVNSLPLLAPLFLVFELWQLVMSERYVGIKQIARGANPREMGPSEAVACLWSLSIVAYGLWMASLLVTPSARVYGLILMAVTAVGYSFRRNCGLKWVLVILTFEGAMRVAVLAPLAVASWMRV